MDVRKEIPDCKKASVGEESIEFPSFSGKDTKLPEINILIQRYVVIKNFDA